MHEHWGGIAVWFDIPVRDLDRAIGFYSTVLGVTIEKHEWPGGGMGVLPHEGQQIGGCLALNAEDNAPSKQGPLLYLNVQGRLDAAEAAVAPGGGQVLQPKHEIPPYGFRTIILDSEGNRVALHSM